MQRDNSTSVRKWMTALTTDQLDNMLQAELEKEVPDGNAVRLILDVLWEREKGNPVEITPGIEKAWEKYQRDAAAIDQKKVSLTFSRSALLRVASIAVVCLLVFTTIPRRAEAENFWARLARWSDSFFEYLRSGEDYETAENSYVFQSDNPELQQVYDAVVEMGITDPVVPTWLPEGYSIKLLKNETKPQKEYLHVCFENGNDEAIYKVILHEGDSSYWYHKDAQQAEYIQIADVKYYALQNNGWWTVSWLRDNIECFLSIDCDESALHQILNSINRMGDTA